MYGRVKTHKDLLKALLTLRPNLRSVLLKACKDEEINCITECIFNTLNGKVPLKDSDKSKLKKHKTVLRKIIKKGRGKFRKRIIIQQGGAFLPIILGAVLNGLMNLI